MLLKHGHSLFRAYLLVMAEEDPSGAKLTCKSVDPAAIAAKVIDLYPSGHADLVSDAVGSYFWMFFRNFATNCGRSRTQTHKTHRSLNNMNCFD
jgi:hypothetical protein